MAITRKRPERTAACRGLVGVAVAPGALAAVLLLTEAAAAVLLPPAREEGAALSVAPVGAPDRAERASASDTRG